MSDGAELDLQKQMNQDDWFMLAAMLLGKLGGDVHLTEADSMVPVGKDIIIEPVEGGGMHLILKPSTNDG